MFLISLLSGRKVFRPKGHGPVSTAAEATSHDPPPLPECSEQGKASTKDEQNFSALPPSLMQKRHRPVSAPEKQKKAEEA